MIFVLSFEKSIVKGEKFMIKVAVCGALGKMGQEVVQAVENAEDMELVAKIDIAADDMYHTIEEAARV